MGILLKSPAYEGSSRGDAQVLGKIQSGCSFRSHNQEVRTPSDHFALMATILRTAPHGSSFPPPACTPLDVFDWLPPPKLSRVRWSLNRTVEAVGSDSQSILHSYRHVSGAIEMLNSEPHKIKG